MDRVPAMLSLKKIKFNGILLQEIEISFIALFYYMIYFKILELSFLRQILRKVSRLQLSKIVQHM